MTMADADQLPAATPRTFSSTNLAVLAVWAPAAPQVALPLPRPGDPEHPHQVHGSRRR